MIALHFEAKATFTDLDTSGEGGELLLFRRPNEFWKIPRFLLKWT